MAGEALTSSLFSWQDAAGNDNVLDVDVVMSSSDERTAKLTDHVVETGAVITDHVVIQPEALSLELLVTQTPHSGTDMALASVTVDSTSRKLVPANVPIKVQPSAFQPGGFLLLTQGVRQVVSGLLSLAGGSAGNTANGSALEETSSSVQAKTLQMTSPVDRVGEVHDHLVDILNNVLLVTVSFKGRLYIDYLLTKVNLENRAGEFGMARFKVELRAFRTVTGTTVALPDPVDFRAKATANKGNKGAKTPDPDPSKKATSALKKGVNKINSLLGQ